MRAAAIVLACLILTGCGQDAPRQLTEAEAQRLATVRLANRTDGGAAVRTTIVQNGERLAVSGWIDWRRPVVYLAVSGERKALVQAVPGGVAVLEPADAAADGMPPIPLPPGTWAARPLVLDRPATGFDTLAGVLLALAADRPENPQLLRQQGAAWLGRDGSLEIYRGPGAGKGGSSGGRTKYWLDERSRLHRLELNPTSGQRMTVEFERAAIPSIPLAEPLRASHG